MSAIFALGFTVIIYVSALTMPHCDGPLGKKAVELKENATRQTVTCDGTGQTGLVQWRYVTSTGVRTTLVTCSSPSSCTDDLNSRFAMGTRNSTSSTLTFVTQALRAGYGTWSVNCFMTAATQLTCQLDVVYPSDVSTPSCSITNDWKIQCSCNVTKAFSTRDRYSCQWFQKTGGQISPIPSASSTVTSPTIVDTDYKRFDCSFSIDLPAVTGAYSYDVKVFPGDVTERAANTIDVEAVYIDTTTDGATAELQSYFGVAVALGVVLAVIVIVNVIVIVLWLKKRHWVLPCAESNQLHRTASKSPQATERGPTMTETCSLPAPTKDTGSAWPRGPYDSLQMSDIGLRSVYSEIGPSEGRDPRPASRDAEYENTPR